MVFFLVTKQFISFSFIKQFAYPWKLLGLFSYHSWEFVYTLHLSDENSELSVPSHKNIEINHLLGSYLWVSFFHKISLQVLILQCSCLQGFIV